MNALESNWAPPLKTRKGTPRANAAVRVKVAHTDHQKRRIEVFITEPVTRALGWQPGGCVAVGFQGANLRLAPSHTGLRATVQSPHSKTLRVVIAGAPLARGLCAKVRPATHRIQDGNLYVALPADWIERAPQRLEAALKLEAWL